MLTFVLAGLITLALVVYFVASTSAPKNGSAIKASDAKTSASVRRPASPRSDYLPEADARELFGDATNTAPPVSIGTYQRQLWLIHSATGRRIVPGNMSLRKFGIYSLNVRGNKYNAGGIRRAKPTVGAFLELLPEPSNQFDPNAIAIGKTVDGKFARVGYVNKGLAKSLTKRMTAGTVFTCMVLRGGQNLDAPFSVLICTTDRLEYLRGNQTSITPWK